MGIVLYDNKKIIPAPFISISKKYDRTDSGDILSSSYVINVTGTLVAWKGSPNSLKNFHVLSGYPADEDIPHESRLGAVLRKQEAIRELFSEDGHPFEIQSLDGSPAIKFYPRIQSIDFQEGVWHDRCDYTIVLEADRLYPQDEDQEFGNIKSATDSWSIEVDESSPESLEHPLSYRITHNVSAKGMKSYGPGSNSTEAITNAKNFVLPRLGLDYAKVMSSGVNNLPSYYQGYNHIRSQNEDDMAGDFSVTETWILSSGNALETFSLNSSIGEDGIRKVSINGNIRGLSTKTVDLGSPYTISDLRFTAASGKYESIKPYIYSRAVNYTGANLTLRPVSTSEGINPYEGTISYTYEYDDRPALCISGSKSEVFSINDTGYGDIFASIPVIGRARGPVLQNINTVTALQRSFNMEVVFGPSILDCSTLESVRNTFLMSPINHPATSGDIYKIIQGVNPASQGFSQVYTSPPTINWEPKTGRFSYNVSWTFER
jgi:hypothetical protein